MYYVEQFYPNWRELSIHEMAPGGRGASLKLGTANDYTSSQYDPALRLGARSPNGWVNQDAERQTYADNSFDLVVTQDVFEHIFDIDAAFREIARTLRPGGAHIFTTPLVNKAKPTEARASRESDGSIRHLCEPEYHGNPVDPKGSLVTWNFGYDLAARVIRLTDMPTVVFSQDRLDLGIQAEYIEVLASLK
jgi:SAM-dependent methyltransferase